MKKIYYSSSMNRGTSWVLKQPAEADEKWSPARTKSGQSMQSRKSLSSESNQGHDTGGEGVQRYETSGKRKRKATSAWGLLHKPGGRPRCTRDLKERLYWLTYHDNSTKDSVWSARRATAVRCFVHFSDCFG